jgi:hypothetical protein
MQTWFKGALECVAREQTEFAFWVNRVYQCQSISRRGEESSRMVDSEQVPCGQRETVRRTYSG